jgi:hypothetical protein
MKTFRQLIEEIYEEKDSRLANAGVEGYNKDYHFSLSAQ